MLLIYSFQFRSAFIPFMAARHRHCFRHRHIPELTSSFNSIDVRTDGRRLARDRLLDIRRYGRPLTKEYDTYHDPCWSLLSPLPRAAILTMARIAAAQGGEMTSIHLCHRFRGTTTYTFRTVSGFWHACPQITAGHLALI